MQRLFLRLLFTTEILISASMILVSEPVVANHEASEHIHSIHHYDRDELFCVEHQTPGEYLDDDEITDYTNTIRDILYQENGWSRKPDSRVQFNYWWNSQRVRPSTCDELAESQSNRTSLRILFRVSNLAECNGTQIGLACTWFPPSGLQPTTHIFTSRTDFSGAIMSIAQIPWDISLDHPRSDSVRPGHLISHETGHVLGLDDPPPGCWGMAWESIMHSYRYGCRYALDWPSHADIQSVLDIINEPYTGGSPPMVTPTPNPLPGPPTPTPTPRPPTPTPTVVPIPTVNLALYASTSLSTVTVGGPATYTLVILNSQGQIAATNVQLVSYIPWGVNFAAFNVNYGPLNQGPCSYDAPTRKFACTFASVATTGSQTVQMQVTTGMQGYLETHFSLIPGSGYRDVSGANDATVPVTVQAQTCDPRPPVTLTTTALGDRLRVTARAGTGSGNAQNRLESVRFGIGSNALIDIGGAIGLTGEVVVPFGDNREEVTFDVRRASPGTATTVRLEVQDHCPTPWVTFVGGGTSAGF